MLESLPGSAEILLSAHQRHKVLEESLENLMYINPSVSRNCKGSRPCAAGFFPVEVSLSKKLKLNRVSSVAEAAV